jgi:DNA-3-methyladenine glycosylase
MKKLPREFYLRSDTIRIAKDLIGKLLVVPLETGERVSGMIVETEAYLGAVDKAAHSYNNRRTARNEITYSIGGHAYVFFIYGMYFQFNVVTDAKDSPHVVLIRAVEPVEGIEIMRERRLVKNPSAKIKDVNLTSGPGKLCIALNINRRLNGEDLLGENIWIEDYKNFSSDKIEIGKRIGIDYAEEFAEKPWRFWLKNNDFVSRK